MRAALNFVVGAAVGAVTGLAVHYLFGPAPDTTFDENYRSRLDWALEEGDRAADAKELELRRDFALAKEGRLPKPQPADLPDTMPPDNLPASTTPPSS